MKSLTEYIVENSTWPKGLSEKEKNSAIQSWVDTICRELLIRPKDEKDVYAAVETFMNEISTSVKWTTDDNVTIEHKDSAIGGKEVIIFEDPDYNEYYWDNKNKKLVSIE